MSVLDLILLFGIFFFAILGFILGFVHTFGSLLGVFIGAYVAGAVFEPIGRAISFLFLGNTSLAQWTVFIIILLFINRLVGLVFWLIKLFFKFIEIIPFVPTFNHLSGAILGFLEGLLIMSAIVYVAVKLPLIGGIGELFSTSPMAKFLILIAKIIAPMLPEALQKVM